jgi:hypothetical protein
LAATEAAVSGVTGVAGAGDSVRTAFAFFFLEALDAVWAGGFWTDAEAMMIADLVFLCVTNQIFI